MTNKCTVPSWGQSSLWTSSGAARLRGLCVWVFVCVCRQQPCLTLWCTCSIFPRPTVQSGRQVVPRSYLSHWLLSLSPLPACLLICSLSSTGDIIQATEGEKEGSLSSAPERLQRATAPPAGEPGTKTYGDYTCAHNLNCTLQKYMALALLLCNQENFNQQEIMMNNTITRRHSISISYGAIADVLKHVKGSVKTGLYLKSTTLTAAGKIKGLSLLKVEGKVKTRQGEMRWTNSIGSLNSSRGVIRG